jgi:L-arabinokinase
MNTNYRRERQGDAAPLILYYVSGHGFGHAARSSRVIRELVNRHGFNVVVRTTAPSFIFLQAVGNGVTVEYADVDSGPAQADCLHTDLPATLERITRHLRDFGAMAQKEAQYAASLNPRAIVADIAPLGVEVGSLLKKPAFVVANFLWDWIYADYATRITQFAPISRRFTEIYSKATRILRTPLSGGMDGYANIADIPLIAPSSKKSKERARAELGFSMDDSLALVSLGGIGSERFFERLGERITKFNVMIPGRDGGRSGNMIRFDSTKTSHGDLLSAADVVVGKLGYGLCSELIAQKRPLLYTHRADFVEYGVLNEGLRKYVAVDALPPDEFFEGSLDGPLLQLVDARHPTAKTPLDGARVAAGIINSHTEIFP